MTDQSLFAIIIETQKSVPTEQSAASAAPNGANAAEIAQLKKKRNIFALLGVGFLFFFPFASVVFFALTYKMHRDMKNKS